MAKSFKLRDFLIGEEVIFSYPKFKRIMLTAYLSLICMIVALTYSVVDLISQVGNSWAGYAVLFFMPLISLRLIRIKKYKAAKVILMISSNIGVFFAAINDPFETGVFLYFIPAAVGSMAILDFHERITAVLLSGCTLILFLLAYFGNLNQVARIEQPSVLYVQFSFISNYIFSVTISFLIIFFLTSLNRRSERELMEKEKLANDKNKELQKVNEELDRFVYSVSHDLRSPLTSILGLTDLAKRTTDPVELNQLIGMIQGRVKAQDHFIREIIDYSRNTRTDVQLEPVNLIQVVDDVLESLRFNPEAKQIVFIKELTDDISIVTDKTRLSVILNNLIGNAIKYHDFNKPNPFIEIGFIKESSAVYVKDNGMGIKPEHEQKIFNMFYRGSDRSTGSGLGLFITKEAVEKLEGAIQLKTVYGEGSTFNVILPSKKTIA